MYRRDLLHKLIHDEDGGELVEYVLIAGLIVVAAFAVVSAIGVKIFAHWTGGDSGP